MYTHMWCGNFLKILKSEKLENRYGSVVFLKMLGTWFSEFAVHHAHFKINID